MPIEFTEPILPEVNVDSKSQDDDMLVEETTNSQPEYYYYSVEDLAKFPRCLFDNLEEDYPCTYNGTYIPQYWFHCKSCNGNDNEKGVCVGCARRCLSQGHEVEDTVMLFSEFVCDNGHRQAGSPKLEGDSDEEEEVESIVPEPTPQEPIASSTCLLM